MESRVSLPKKIFCLLLAFCSLYGIEGMFKISDAYYPISNSIFSLIIYVGLFFLYFQVLVKPDKRLLMISLILGFLFSFFMVCGTNIILYNGTLFNLINTHLKILCGTPIFSAITFLLIRWVSYCPKPTLDSKLDKKLLGKLFFIAWALIFIAWLPGLIASYPGVYGYDSIHQVNYYRTGEINLHHPLVHSYLLGFCVITLGEMFGSYEVGMLFYSLIQMFILSASLATIFVYMSHKRISAPVKYFFLILFMFLPTNVIMSFSATKDILFAAFFLMVTLLFMMATENNQLLYKKSFCAALIAAIFLFMIFKNQGIYVILFGMVIAFVLLRKHWKRISIILLSCLILYVVYSGPITKLCGGVKATTGIIEMMSVPCVQLSRARMYCEAELTEEEKELIEIYVSGWIYYEVNSGISDMMKGSFNTERFSENPGEFIKLWTQIGLKCPTAYIDAFARLSIGLWYPDMNYRDSTAYHPYWEYNQTDQIYGDQFLYLGRSTPAFMQWLSNIYEKLSYNNSYQKIPVISMLFSSGLPVWILLLYIAWCIYSRNYNLLIPASFILAMWLTLLLGPVVLYRYIYPIVVTVPLLICSSLTTGNRTKTKKEAK